MLLLPPVSGFRARANTFEHLLPFTALVFCLSILAILTLSGVDAKQPAWTHTADDWVETVDVSADGKYMVAGTAWDDTGVYLFNATSGDELWNHTTNDFVNSVAISAEGEYMVAGGSDLFLYERSSGTPLWTYDQGGDMVSVDISADGEYLVAGSYDNSVYLFDRDSSTPLWKYTVPGQQMVSTVSISGDGEYISAGSNDDNVYLFDRDSNTPLWNREIGLVASVDLSADGSYLAALNESGVVFLFGRDSSTPLWSYDMGEPGDELALSDDGAYLATGSRNDRVYAFGRDSSTPLWSIDTGSNIRTTDISGDGNYIVAAGFDHVLYYIRRDNGTTMWTYDPGGFGNLETAALSRDGSVIGLGGSDPDWVSAFHQNVPVINELPTAHILAVIPDPAAEGEELFFDGWGDDNDGTIVGYRWKLDGVEVATVKFFNLAAPTAATYLVEFQVQDDRGDWSEPANLSLRVHQRPVAVIVSITPNPAQEGQSVSFLGSSSDDGSVVAYEWRLDGYVESDLNSFSRSDLNRAVYAVRYRVQDDYGAWSLSVNTTLVVNEADNLPPTASIDSLSPNPVSSVVNVTGVGNGTDADGTVVAYRWLLDGVEVATTAVMTLAELTVGEHMVELMVQDEDGAWSAPVNRTLVVDPSDNEVPVAYIVSITPNPSAKGQRVHLEGRGYDPNGTLTAYQWRINGLEISTLASTFMDDLPVGEHSLEFRVRDDEGLWSTAASAQLRVLQPTEDNSSRFFDLPPNTYVTRKHLGGNYVTVDVNLNGWTYAAGTSFGPTDAIYFFSQVNDEYKKIVVEDANVHDISMSLSGNELAVNIHGEPGHSSQLQLLSRPSSHNRSAEGYLDFSLDWQYDLFFPYELSISDYMQRTIYAIGSRIYMVEGASSPIQLDPEGNGPVLDLAIDLYGKVIVAGRGNGLQIFSEDQDWLPWTVNSLEPIVSVDVNAEDHVVAASKNGHIMVLELGRAQTDPTLVWSTDIIVAQDSSIAVQFTRYSDYLVVGSGSRIQIFDISKGFDSVELFREYDFGTGVIKFDIDHEGRHLAVGTENAIYMIDVLRDEGMSRYPLHEGELVTDLAISAITYAGNHMSIVGTSFGDILVFYTKPLPGGQGSDDNDDSPSLSLSTSLLLIVGISVLMRRRSRKGR